MVYFYFILPYFLPSYASVEGITFCIICISLELEFRMRVAVNRHAFTLHNFTLHNLALNIT
jgi:hypothetical protein